MAEILVVDDDPDVLHIISTALDMAGHQVIRASNGLAALDVLDKKDNIDLLLTDIIMPGLNGFNLARMAKIRSPYLKILYLTGYHEMAITLRDQGDRLGKLLTKPILPDALTNEVNNLLKERERS